MQRLAERLNTMVAPAHKARVLELTRYFVVGASNVFIDFIIYVFFTRGWDFWRQHYLLANCISFIVVVTWSFFWNKFWTFKERSGLYQTQYAKFIIITIVGLGIYQSIFAIGVEYFHRLDLVVKLMAIPAMALWNYGMHKLWTFRTKKG